MRSSDDIEDVIREANCAAPDAMRRRLWQEVAAGLRQARTAERTRGNSQVRRIIMNSRIAKPAVAAAVVIAAIAGMRWSGSGTAYGLTEAIRSYDSADTVHVKGWSFFRQDTPYGQELRGLPYEYWLDKKGGRYKSLRGIGFSDSDPNRPNYYLGVSDGQYVMKTSYHTDRVTKVTTPSARFEKVGGFQQRVEVRTMEAFPGFFANLNQVKGFSRIGQERMGGTIADVWMGEITGPGETLPYEKLMIWLSPSTRKILRMVRWDNKDKDSVRWVLRQDAHTIEYNVVPPADCFRTDAPDGYRLDNTKATATARNFGDDVVFGGRAKFYGCIGFTLNDGTVIYGWHANPRPEESQAPLFTEVKPGDPLPKLPARVAGLKPWPLAKDTTLTGRHLAWTRKGAKYYEWGIYVADKKMPPRDTFQAYKTICEYDGVEPQGFRSVPNLMDPELVIQSEEEFNTWVRAAMAELSDNGMPPDHVTYERVTQLAQRIRAVQAE